jgi:hypothetical protein
MKFTRREFGRLALATIPAGYVGGVGTGTAAQTAAKPNSVVRGVGIGMNLPYNFGGRNASIDDLINSCTALGVSVMELRSQPIETFLGAPDRLMPLSQPRRAGGATPEQLARAEADARAVMPELEKWRLGVSLDRLAELRRRFEAAGLAVPIVRVDGMFDMSDAVVDYKFRLARAVGARAISTEIDESDPARIGKYADKHQMFVGYHGHAGTSVAHFEHVFSQARFNGANLDLGHFVAGQNMSPVPFITRHHDRITHIHVKDRKLNNGPNVPFGEGDTPIAEVLRLIRDNRWNIQAIIEFEYPVPPGSDRMTELKKTVEYCRSVLA